MSITPATAQSETLSFKEESGYALGDTASNLFWMTFVYFGSYFYTDVLRLAPAAMATLFFVTRILDTVFDPVMGMIADRTNTRWGKFRLYIIWMVVPFGVCGTLAFISPPFGAHGKLVWAYVTYGLIGLVYSAINLPYSALLGVISPNTVERTKASSFRFVGAYSAGLVVSLCTMYLVDFFGGTNKQTGFAMTVGLYALLGMVMWIVCFATTKERVRMAMSKKALSNPYGYFDDEAREHVITRPDTPTPWFNYIGEGRYGGIISNTGGGFSFDRDPKNRRVSRYRYNSIPADQPVRYVYPATWSAGSSGAQPGNPRLRSSWPRTNAVAASVKDKIVTSRTRFAPTTNSFGSSAHLAP